MSSVTTLNIDELFNSIKSNIDDVRKMKNLCDAHIALMDSDNDNEPYLYFKEQLSKKITSLQEAGDNVIGNGIRTINITNYTHIYSNACPNCDDEVLDIACNINGIYVNIHKVWADRLRMNNFIFNIGYKICFTRYESDLKYITSIDNKWLESELAKTGHTIPEFCIVLQTLCN